MLGLFHLAWFLPFIAGTWSIESTGLKYDCSVAKELRAANYGLFSIFLLSAIVEFSIVAIGLRGGPLETHRRRRMQPLLYCEVFLWVSLLAFTSESGFSPGAGAAGLLAGGAPCRPAARIPTRKGCCARGGLTLSGPCSLRRSLLHVHGVQPGGVCVLLGVQPLPLLRPPALHLPQEPER